ncbi:MAG: fatty acid hydroxylase family protein [Planctomycetota bacterium]|nr:MAG: fatty acid hydroxylase family protein [Planctomycetota bacterium]
MLASYAETLGLACIPAFLLLDLLVRHRAFPAPRWWRLRALAVTVAAFFLSMAVVMAWGSLLGDFHLLPGEALGTWGGAVVGVLVYELLHYAYHRLAHRWDPLWRWSHQLHHSAESLDAFGAYFLHPIDVVLFTTISSLVFFPLLGLNLAAGALGGAFLVFNAMFQHANLKTPRWVGYLVQRPESHSLHHAKGIHAYNYSDLPLWDIIFGTFKNPTEMETELGFYPGASNRLAAMLVGRDVSLPPEETKDRAGKPALEAAV